MKHLILFINHAQSRLDNAVYRLFASSVLGRRNSVLLFEPKLPDERLLTHEVAELCKKQKAADDVTFHICADFRQEDQATDVITTLRLIRSLFPSNMAKVPELEAEPKEKTLRKDPQLTFFDIQPEDDEADKPQKPQFAYPTFVYALTNDARQCSETERSVLWKNLTAISQAASDNYACHLISSCLLYLPSQQQALAEFLYDSATRNADHTALYTPFEASCSYPPIFGSINAEGVSYPEEEVRHYLLLCCLRDTLRLGHPESHPTPMEESLEQAQYILSQVPLQNERLLLQEEVFLNINADHLTQWALPADYWSHQIDLACQGLNDLARDDWFIRVRQRVEALYQTRFRDMGVDFFFNVQTKIIDQYNAVLLAIISEHVDKIMKEHVYAPKVQQDIIRAIVNTLQQKVLYLQQQEQNEQHDLMVAEQMLNQQNTEWGKIGIWGRLRGKDQVLLGEYSKQLKLYYTLRTRVAGYPFAINLLNQLIPQLSALSEVAERRQEILSEALLIVELQLSEARPSHDLQLFDAVAVDSAARCISDDRHNLDVSYSLVYGLFYGHGMPLNGDEFLSRIRFELDDKFEEYVSSHAAQWTHPQVLGLPIGQRVEQCFEQQGGKEAFILQMRSHIPILLPIKPEAQPADLWLYSETDKHLEVIHFQHGLSLSDFDGFSGQRAYIEASLF